jgi:hypothetical protein
VYAGIFPVFTCTQVRVLLDSTSSGSGSSGGVGTGTVLTLINIHPTLTPTDMQEAAVAFLRHRIEIALVGSGGQGNHTSSSGGRGAAVIVTGDFNIGPEDPMLDQIYALGLRHAFHPNRTQSACMLPLQPGGLGRCEVRRRAHPIPAPPTRTPTARPRTPPPPDSFSARGHTHTASKPGHTH